MNDCKTDQCLKWYERKKKKQKYSKTDNKKTGEILQLKKEFNVIKDHESVTAAVIGKAINTYTNSETRHSTDARERSRRMRNTILKTEV